MKFVVLVVIPFFVLIDESLLVAVVLGFVDKLVEVNGFAIQNKKISHDVDNFQKIIDLSYVEFVVLV